MKDTIEALKTLIEGNYLFHTIYRGYPFVIRQEDICEDLNNTSRKGGCGIYAVSDISGYKSTGYDESILTVVIELYISAKTEIQTDDRGEENEEWLMEKATSIRDLIIDNHNLTVNTYLVEKDPIKITYGSLEGLIRTTKMEISFRKRIAR